MTAGPSPLERLRRSGVRPERGYGQNFLIDPNILDVIERLAGLTADDVVLEVGPGLGVLTERLLDRCRLVHCLEIDRRLAGLLEVEFGSRPGFDLHMVDAMAMDFGALKPPPTRFVANLPYNVAVPLIIKSLEELPVLKLWCLMLQKEIADRLFARTGAANYGAVSVMLRLLCEKQSQRPVSGTVFHPRPRVNSSLLVFSRRQRPVAIEPFPAVKSFVYAAFSHRRKTLVNSMADAEAAQLPAPLASLAPAERKRRLVALLAETGLPANIRPQNVEPEQYEALAARLLAGEGDF